MFKKIYLDVEKNIFNLSDDYEKNKNVLRSENEFKISSRQHCLEYLRNLLMQSINCKDDEANNLGNNINNDYANCVSNNANNLGGGKILIFYLF